MTYVCIVITLMKWIYGFPSTRKMMNSNIITNYYIIIYTSNRSRSERTEPHSFMYLSILSSGSKMSETNDGWTEATLRFTSPHQSTLWRDKDGRNTNISLSRTHTYKCFKFDLKCKKHIRGWSKPILSFNPTFYSSVSSFIDGMETINITTIIFSSISLGCSTT